MKYFTTILQIFRAAAARCGLDNSLLYDVWQQIANYEHSYLLYNTRIEAALNDNKCCIQKSRLHLLGKKKNSRILKKMIRKRSSRRVSGPQLKIQRENGYKLCRLEIKGVGPYPEIGVSPFNAWLNSHESRPQKSIPWSQIKNHQIRSKKKQH